MRWFRRPSSRRCPVLRVERLEGRDVPSGSSAPLLLQLRADAGDALGRFAADARLRGAELRPTDVPGLFAATGPAADLAALFARWSVDPAARFAERSQTLRVALTPNDPRYNDGSLWGLSGANGVRAAAAWDQTTGSTGVVVADVDTGVDYNHPDLYKNIWVNQAEIPADRRANLLDLDADGRITFWDLNDPRDQGPGKITDQNGDGWISGADLLAPWRADGTGGWADGLSQDGDGRADDLIGWNFVTNTNNPSDDHGHGTHTTGTMLAVGDNGLGVVGVAWKGQVMALKFLDATGSGSDLAAAGAIRYAADHGARVSNNSWGGDAGGSVIFDAVQYAAAKGQVFVAAAGNSGRNTDQTPNYPSGYDLPNIVSVAATDAAGALASFSNYGTATVDLGAPGVNVFSTVPGGYGSMSGTSMAAPHVAGVVALVFARQPSWTYQQAIDRVLATVTPLASLAGRTRTGGLVNAAAAVAPAPASGALFADDFSGPSVNPAWSFRGGDWAQAGGVLRQTGLGVGDPKKAVVTGQSFPADVQVTARVRVDTWDDSDAARAGVGLGTDAAGNGYNLVFHGGAGGRRRVQFLDDQVAWGNAYDFAWNPGTWYWFKLQRENGVLSGKVWQDGAAEPANWSFQQTGWTGRAAGAPALNGGANAGATVSFDDVTVSLPNAAPPPATPPAAPANLTATAASASQIRLTWSDVAGETGYQVERSPNGIDGWAAVASPPADATSYDDGGLQPGTTYYYRVRAVNAAGASPYSAVASATTAPPAPSGGTLFADDFSGPSVNPAWSFRGGDWAQAGGVLRQTGLGVGDPKKALVTGVTTPADVEVTARVRVDTWDDTDAARAGVGLGTDAAGNGYNLVFHGGAGGRRRVQFLDDQVAWGNAYDFAWNPGTWYWFKLQRENGVLSGKVWRDGEAEPADWMFRQDGWTGRAGGSAALNGGANAGATASFDDVAVRAV